MKGSIGRLMTEWRGGYMDDEWVDKLIKGCIDEGTLNAKRKLE